ncbi:MAG: fluoride efflux transporter CrcB [bacterium]
MNGLLPFLWVGAGGLVGSLCRYGFTLFMSYPAASLPWGTLASNISGCLIIGAVSQLAAGTELLSPSTRLFLATGFCGGFTTLSSLIYELVQMVKDGEWLHAVIYLNGTFFGALAAYFLGMMMIKVLEKT